MADFEHIKRNIFLEISDINENNFDCKKLMVEVFLDVAKIQFEKRKNYAFDLVECSLENFITDNDANGKSIF